MLQKLKNRQPQAGFTLVELLIVIVVIAILAAIAISAFSGVQAQARDSQRQSDIKTVQSQLELYYADNGYFPTAAEMTAAPSTVGGASGTLEGMDPEAVTDPQTDSGTSSFQTSVSTGTGEYGYVVTPAACDNSATDCTSYTLSYWAEAADTPAAIEVEDVSGE